MKITFFLSFLNADFCCGSILISFGAVLGVLSPVQLIVMAIFETICYAVNELIVIHFFEVSKVLWENMTDFVTLQSSKTQKMKV